MFVPLLYSERTTLPIEVFSLILLIDGSSKFLALKFTSHFSPILFFQMKSNVGIPFSIIFPKAPAPKASILSEKYEKY